MAVEQYMRRLSAPASDIIGGATLARLSSPLIGVVPAALDSAAVPSRFLLRAPASFRPTPVGLDPTQSALPSSIGARYTRVLSLRDRPASSTLFDIARHS